MFDTFCSGSRVGKAGLNGQQSGLKVRLEDVLDVVIKKLEVVGRSDQIGITRRAVKGCPVRANGEVQKKNERKKKKEYRKNRKQRTLRPAGPMNCIATNSLPEATVEKRYQESLDRPAREQS